MKRLGFRLLFLLSPLLLGERALASSGTARVGQTVIFSVTVNGTAPFTYQWYKDGAKLTGATAATYVVANAQLAAAGTYWVVIANSAGSTTSDNAVLTMKAGATLVAPQNVQAKVLKP